MGASNRNQLIDDQHKQQAKFVSTEQCKSMLTSTANDATTTTTSPLTKEISSWLYLPELSLTQCKKEEEEEMAEEEEKEVIGTNKIEAAAQISVEVQEAATSNEKNKSFLLLAHKTTTTIPSVAFDFNSNAAEEDEEEKEAVASKEGLEVGIEERQRDDVDDDDDGKNGEFAYSSILHNQKANSTDLLVLKNWNKVEKKRKREYYSLIAQEEERWLGERERPLLFGPAIKMVDKMMMMSKDEYDEERVSLSLPINAVAPSDAATVNLAAEVKPVNVATAVAWSTHVDADSLLKCCISRDGQKYHDRIYDYNKLSIGKETRDLEECMLVRGHKRDKLNVRKLEEKQNKKKKKKRRRIRGKSWKQEDKKDDEINLLFTSFTGCQSSGCQLGAAANNHNVSLVHRIPSLKTKKMSTRPEWNNLHYRTMVVVFAIIALVYPTPGAECVDCFKCSSRNGSNPACEDPFHNLNTTRVLSPVLPDPQPSVIYHTPCYAGKKGRDGLFPASACIKLTGIFDKTGETLVVRHCALDSGTLTQDTELARMSHCGKFQFEGDLLRGCVLACPEDACNQALTIKPLPTSTLLPLGILSILALKFVVYAQQQQFNIITPSRSQ